MTTEMQAEVQRDPEGWLWGSYFPQCTDCTVSGDIRPTNESREMVYPRGDFNSPIVIVGEAPGRDEEREGEAFVGRAGKKLEDTFNAVGIYTRKAAFVTNTVKCRPTNNRTPTSEECRICREKYLQYEITAYPRKLIVALGNIGYYGVVPKGTPSGIMSRSGIFEESEEFGCYILPCIHPAAVLRNPSNEVLLRDVAEKVKQFIDDGYTVPPQRSVIYREVHDLESFGELIQDLRESEQFVIDIETTGFNFWADRILCMVFSTGLFSAWYLPMEEDGNWVWPRSDWALIQEGLRQVFEDPSIGKIGHNLKFDLKFLIHYFGWDIRGTLSDSMLMHHLLDENTAHGLKPLAARFTDLGNYSKDLESAFNEVKRSRIPIEEKHYGKIPVSTLKSYALADADATFRLYELFRSGLKESSQLYKFYSKIITKVMKTLMYMELVGVRVDTERMSELSKEFDDRLEELQEEINSYAEEDVNVRSTKQLRSLLYEQLGLPALKDPRLRTPKGGPSTDEATLKALRERTKHPVLDLLLEYRRTAKLNSTYIAGLLKVLAPDGRLHTSYLQHGTATGRLASSRPNLQNIPRESIIKGLFIPTEDWYLVRGDYSQHELRMWANYSKDPKFIEVLATDDVHSHLGSILLNKSPDQISIDERTKVKGVVFGLIYGRGARSLAAEFEMSDTEAQAFIDSFFKMFPISSRWLKDQEAFVKQQGYVKNLFGRYRRLPEIHSTDTTVSAMAARQARNSPIQSLASDVTNLALTRIDEAFRGNGLKARLLMQIHDEIVAEAPKGEVRDAVNIMREQMLAPIRHIIVPLKIDLGVVERWGGDYLDLGQF